MYVWSFPAWWVRLVECLALVGRFLILFLLHVFKVYCLPQRLGRGIIQSGGVRRIGRFCKNFVWRHLFGCGLSISLFHSLVAGKETTITLRDLITRSSCMIYLLKTCAVVSIAAWSTKICHSCFDPKSLFAWDGQVFFSYSLNTYSTGLASLSAPCSNGATWILYVDALLHEITAVLESFHTNLNYLHLWNKFEWPFFI